MEIVDNRAVKLMLKNPHRVTAVIPKSAIVGEVNGVYETLVHWGLEEVQVLKNLGFKDVPSPITVKYNWPGLYKPFDHQKVTAGFLTLHRRCYCFNEQGCVDSETEYLSPTGWVKISEYSGGKVAQYNLDTGIAEFVDPKEYVKLPCNTMYKIKSPHGLDQMLSPEHRVLIKDHVASYSGRDKSETISAEELYNRQQRYMAGEKTVVTGPRKLGTPNIAFSLSGIPTTYKMVTNTTIPLTEAELRVQVAVIADGHFGGNTNLCVMRLKKERKKDRLRELLSNANLQYKERLDTSVSGAGFTVFSFYAPRRDKVFSKEYWLASSEQLHIIYDEVQYWDSCITRGYRFSSYVKESADFVQYVATATGHTARINTSVRERRGRVETEYTVQIRDTQILGLRNKGEGPGYISVAPSTDGYKYCFMVPSTYLVFRRNGCVFVSGNTGKTVSVAWASDYLMSRGFIKRVLIVCPLSIMESAWRDDLFKVAMHRRVDVAYGTKEKRKQIIASDAEYVIINFDGIETVVNEIANGGFDLVVIDEANAVKTVSTKRWKTINSIITPNTWLWMLTGTPASQSPVDAYGLAKLLNPSSVPAHFGSFRDMVMYKITNFKWVPKDNAVERVNQVLQPAIRFTKEDCLDLPEILYTARHIPLTPQQTRFYNDLKSQFTVSAAGTTITSVNAATNINKLLQVSSGAVYADDGSVIEFDISSRFNELLDAIEASTHKVLVFAPFRHAIQLLKDKLRAVGIPCESIDGSVPVGKRTEIFNDFQTTQNLRVLVIQPQAAAHGVTLHAANTIVWWGPIPSVEYWLQANARVHRAGQKNPCLVVKLWGSQTEKKLYKILESGENMQTALMNLYKEEVES